MVVGDLRAVRTGPIRDRHSGAKVNRHEIALLLWIKPRESRALQIDLPAVGHRIVMVAVAHYAYSSSQRNVPHPTKVLLIRPQAMQSRLFESGQIGAVDEPVGQDLPFPAV